MKRRHLPQHLQARVHPVAIAIAARRVASTLRDTVIELYLAEDGADATDTLSMLGWYFSLAAQVAMLRHGRGDALTRRLHGALRTVHAMCLAGYRWQTALTPALDNALQEAKDLLVRYPDTAMPWEPSAETHRQKILRHEVQAGDVAGAELYAPAPQGAEA